MKESWKEAFAPLDTIPHRFRNIEANMIRWFIYVIIPVWIVILIATLVASRISTDWNCFIWIGTFVSTFCGGLSPFVRIFEKE